MRIFFTTTMLAFALTVSAFSQGNSGLGFNYQAVVRGADGFVLPKQSVELRFSLMPGQQATQASWVETHNVITDDYGTVGVTVGKGTKAGGVAAQFKDVNFAAVYYWMKVEIKEGSNYRELSYTALPSVPYAEAATNAAGVPVGTILPFAGNSISKVPEGWLLCDGKEISRSEYAALYAVISTAWGAGNNSTTFNIPDTRGVFLRGWSGTSGRDADAEKRTASRSGGYTGNAIGSYQNDAAPNITGKAKTISEDWQLGGSGEGAIGKENGYYSGVTPRSTDGQNAGAITFDASRSSAVYGRDGANEIRPKNIYVHYIIKY
ncbi:MAG: phage tail protein [Bacteroidetes bacterium]|nr:phage tail protein [Bacteroidota bacterium]